MKKKIIFLCIASAFLFVLGITKLDDIYQIRLRNAYAEAVKEASAYKESKQLSALENMIHIEDNETDCEVSDFISAYNANRNESGGEILLSPSEFKSKANIVSGYHSSKHASVEIKKLNKKIQETDICILQFEIIADSCIPVKISVNNEIDNRIIVTKEKQLIAVPLTGITEVNSILFEIESDATSFNIDSVYLLNYSSDYKISELATGYYTIDNRTKTNIDVTSKELIINEESKQFLKDGEYYYNISSSSLIVYRYEEELNAVIRISEVTDIPEIRDMVFSADKRALIISARQTGVYIVDITDPYNPTKIAHYDALEAVSGLAVNGNYAFLCSRYFGVEVVDISDKTNPTFVCKINADAEYQDCYVSGQYLYVGVYAQRRVDIFDISNLNDVKQVSTISLDGSGQGLVERDGILYVSTGLKSANKAYTIADFGYGTGNGLEIYDLSDVYNPKMLSKAKANGRLWINTNDIWDVYLAGDYVYVSDMFNGVMVYDISEPTRPRCVEEITISASKEDNSSSKYDENKYAVSWNQNIGNRYCINHVFTEQGKVYLVSSESGIYQLERDYAVSSSDPIKGEYTCSNKNTPIIIQSKLQMEHISVNNASTWSICKNNDDIYLAAGEEGIIKLDKNLKQVAQVNTKYSVKDVKIYNNYLFTAESEGGIAVYDINNGLQEVGRLYVDSNKYVVSQIQINNTGNTLLAQVTPYRYVIFDISNISNMKSIYSGNDTGAMYYRNISPEVVDDRFVIYGRNKIVFIDSKDSSLDMTKSIANSFYEEPNGISQYGTTLVQVSDFGIRYYDIQKNEWSDTYRFCDEKVKGKCRLYKNTLVISDGSKGIIYIVDISEKDNPTLVDRIEINGNPDIAFIDDTSIIVPCRNMGLVQISLE